MPQLFQKLADIGANLRGVRINELCSQFFDDLRESTLAVAALEHLPPRALELDCAFGKQDQAFLIAARLGFGSPAASGGEAWDAGIFGRGHASGPALGRDMQKAKAGSSTAQCD